MNRRSFLKQSGAAFAALAAGQMLQAVPVLGQQRSLLVAPDSRDYVPGVASEQLGGRFADGLILERVPGTDTYRGVRTFDDCVTVRSLSARSERGLRLPADGEEMRPLCLGGGDSLEVSFRLKGVRDMPSRVIATLGMT